VQVRLAEHTRSLLMSGTRWMVGDQISAGWGCCASTAGGLRIAGGVRLRHRTKLIYQARIGGAR
jgi:hypothetical protein